MFMTWSHDQCFYVKKETVEVILISLHVVDLLVAGCTIQKVLELKQELSNRFVTKDWGETNL